jgi:PKD repeat protein
MKFCGLLVGFLFFAVSQQAQTIIIDNITGGSSTYAETGVWNNSTASGYYGTTSRVPGNSNDPTRTATFTPNIVTPGIYKVYENHAAASNREEDALFTIVDRNGNHEVLVNQKTSGSNFSVYLGQYEFNAGTSGYVRLSERTNTGTQLWVNADAIKFEYQGPVSGNAEFSASPLSQVTGGTVSFTDQSTLAGITSWLWNFGDGTTSSLQNPSHIYATAGLFSITLTVSNATESKSITKTNYITITAPVTGMINLLTNPGAETGVVSPWYTYANGPALQVTTAQQKSGSRSFLSANRTQYYHGPACNIKSLVTGGQLVNGKRYTFSVWVRHGEAVARDLHLTLKKVDGSGTKYITLENESVPPNTWVKIVKHYTMAITGTLTGLELYVISSSGYTFPFYSDDFNISEPEDYTPPASSLASDFVRVNGKNLITGTANDPVLMKGINIFMPVDATNTTEDTWDIKSVSPEDFANISAIGFNSIRMEMYYKTFEDDANPGVFKEDGWRWLDRVIQLAKGAGLKVLLDMHAPQGGYQSDKAQGFSAFWGSSATDPNTANQNRLIALWKAIADRYKHEPAICGFDLINEPRPYNSEEWYSFAEQIIAAIRTVDNQHLIFLEVPLISNYTIRTVNDARVVYDAHMYSPWEYCIQYSAAYGKAGIGWGAYDPVNPVYMKYIGSTLTIVPQGTSGSVAFNKAYLQNSLAEDILQFGYSNNVPVNVGEYGLCYEMFSQNVGALSYMEDFTDVFDGNNAQAMPVSRFYFAYHGAPFSIYTNWNGFQTNEANVNNSLKNFFISYFLSPSMGYLSGNTGHETTGSSTLKQGEIPVIIKTEGLNILISSGIQLQSVRITDMTGRTIPAFVDIADNKVRLHLTASGVYILQIITSEGIVTKKVGIR